MLSDQENTMRQLATEQSFPEERLLINELTHRINNEFASAISLVSLAAVRSSNREVKVALTSVVELLHHYADVYRALQMPEHRTRIDVTAYLEQLCLSMSRSKLDFVNSTIADDDQPPRSRHSEPAQNRPGSPTSSTPRSPRPVRPRDADD
jgi:two-component sensor histidine kinase